MASSPFSFGRFFKAAANICKVFALCSAHSAALSLLVGAHPAFRSVPGRRKGTQMTRVLSTRLHGMVRLYFIFCKWAKQMPAFTTGATDRVQLRLTGPYFPPGWEPRDVPFLCTSQVNCCFCFCFCFFNNCFHLFRFILCITDIFLYI